MNISIDGHGNFEKLKAEKDRIFRDLLPIEIAGDTGAIVIGNPETPCLLIAQFKAMSGFYEALPVSLLPV